jgi:hypothetical protein
MNELTLMTDEEHAATAGYKNLAKATATNDTVKPSWERSWDKTSQRRKHERREQDHCVAVLGGKTVPVENWSFGGVLVDSDDRLYAIGQAIEVTLKFKLRNAILEVAHHGTVVRKAAKKVAVSFEPIGTGTRRAFQQVVDDAIAAAFADSQAPA